MCPDSPLRTTAQPPPGRPASRWLARAFRALLVLAILGAAGAVSAFMLTNRPRSQRRRPRPTAALVEVQPVRRGRRRVIVDAMGTVQAARQITLTPRVAGEVVWVSGELIPGGRLDANEPAVRLDPTDFELALSRRSAELRQLQSTHRQRLSEVAQRQADITRAECALQTEQGNQQVARREYELLGKEVEDVDLALVLREPALRTAQADCNAARAAKAAAAASAAAAAASAEAAGAALRQAKLDLWRATVRAPFNAVVLSDAVDVGSQVSAGSAIAELIGADEFWVVLTVPVDRLKWIRIPRAGGQAGAEVRIYHEAAWGPGVHRTGRVVRLAADLQPQGRMARLIVSVADPLSVDSPDRPPLLVGSYVRAEIVGVEVPDVVEVPRAALRDGRRVWLAADDDTLAIRDVDVLWGRDDSVYVRDALADGDRLITSDLGAPVAGMAIRVAGTPRTRPAGGPPAGSGPRTGPEGRP
jgi:multidrug efflux pump subunit AcrA (membrane-fusion protein)